MDKTIPKEILSRITFKTGHDGTETVAAIEPVEKTCPDCGLPTPQGRSVHIRLCSETGAQWRHTKHKCTACRSYLDPVTGEWGCSLEEVASHFRKARKPRR